MEGLVVEGRDPAGVGARQLRGGREQLQGAVGGVRVLGGAVLQVHAVLQAARGLDSCSQLYSWVW